MTSSDAINKSLQSDSAEDVKVRLQAFTSLLRSTLKTHSTMKKTMIARLDSLRMHKREGLRSGNILRSFFKGRILHVNPGFAAFVVGMDGAFHPVPPGRTVLDAHGENSNPFLMWLRNRSEEGVTLFYYRSVEIPMSLTWPVTPAMERLVEINAEIEALDRSIDDIAKKLRSDKLKDKERGPLEDDLRIENKKREILQSEISSDDFWENAVNAFEAGLGIRSKDDYSGFVSADLQIRVKDPMLFFQTVIAGSRKYQQWMDQCQGLSEESPQENVTVFDLYESTQSELTQAIQNAIRQQTAFNLVEDRDARDHVHGEVAEHIRRTFENYGLDLSRIPTLSYRSAQYEVLTKKRASLRDKNLGEGLLIDQAAVELEKKKKIMELQGLEKEAHQDQYIKLKKKESEVQSEKRVLETQQYKEGVDANIEKQHAHNKLQDVVDEDKRRRASDEGSFNRAQQTVQNDHLRKEEALDKDHQRVQKRADHELQLEQERAQIQIKAEKARLALELYKEQKSASTERFLQILSQIKELPLEIQEMILAKELGPEAVKLIQARTNMQMIEQQRQIEQRHMDELKQSMSSNTQLLHQLANKGIEAYAYVQGKKFDSQKPGLTGGDAKIKKIEMEIPDEDGKKDDKAEDKK